MLTLYYARGACSLASHIALEESGATYERKEISLAKGEQQTEAYLKINPRGRVPVLGIDGEFLLENVAIQTYVANQFPKANLLPVDPMEQARALSLMAWFSNTVHPSFAHFARPERFAPEEAARPGVKEHGKKVFFANCQEIDSSLAGKDWFAGKRYSVVDSYSLVFYAWGTRIGLPMTELKNYTAVKERTMERPAVRRVLEREESVLVKAA